MDAGCVPQDAGYSAVTEPLFGTATDRGGSSEQPTDLTTFCALNFLLSDSGAPQQPLFCASLPAASPSVAGRRVPGPKSSVSPPVQHLDPDQVEVRMVDLQNERCRSLILRSTDWMLI